MPDLHFISGLPRSGSTLLSAMPPDVFRRFENDAFWRDPAQRRAGIAVI